MHQCTEAAGQGWVHIASHGGKSCKTMALEGRLQSDVVCVCCFSFFATVTGGQRLENVEIPAAGRFSSVLCATRHCQGVQSVHILVLAVSICICLFREMLLHFQFQVLRHKYNIIQQPPGLDNKKSGSKFD